MKNKIITFIIGILLGSTLTTIGFNIYSRSIMNNRWMLRSGIDVNKNRILPEIFNNQGKSRIREHPQRNNFIIENNKVE